jgi:hypothetical protein
MVTMSEFKNEMKSKISELESTLEKLKDNQSDPEVQGARSTLDEFKSKWNEISDKGEDAFEDAKTFVKNGWNNVENAFSKIKNRI